MNPYTVLLMMPGDYRDDQCCEADWIAREHVTAANEDQALGDAQDAAAARFEFGNYQPGDFSPVAIYAGHLFDLHQS